MTSRRQRLVDPEDPWLKGLRAVMRQIAADGTKLVIGHGTAGSEFFIQLARRFKINFEVLADPPEIDDGVDIPSRDRQVFFAAEAIYVLSIRSNGHLHRLLNAALQTRDSDSVPQSAEANAAEALLPGRSAPEIILVDLPGLQSTAIRNALCAKGAELWQPLREQCRPLERSSHLARPTSPLQRPPNGEVYLIVPFPRGDEWQFLSHTTRACPGPWPDQSLESYIDQLAESDWEADHRPIGSLCRILRQQRLLASHRAIRSGFDVVSFTECPLLRLPELHQFRTHRVRWDFEPFGLCIRKKWLIDQGARQVIYGDESRWKSLPDSERPFFQLASGASGIDWSVEREWRHPGDLDLNQLTAEDVLIFVPNFEAAKVVAQVTCWPITLWPSEPAATEMSTH